MYNQCLLLECYQFYYSNTFIIPIDTVLHNIKVCLGRHPNFSFIRLGHRSTPSPPPSQRYMYAVYVCMYMRPVLSSPLNFMSFTSHDSLLPLLLIQGISFFQRHGFCSLIKGNKILNIISPYLPSRLFDYLHGNLKRLKYLPQLKIRCTLLKLLCSLLLFRKFTIGKIKIFFFK